MPLILHSGNLSPTEKFGRTPMRFEKTESIVRLALMMQGSAIGVGLADIQQEFGVSRRTAERMRDAVMRLFPSAEETATSENIKRWKIPPAKVSNLVDFSTLDFEAMHTAVALLDRESLPDQAESLKGVIARLQAIMNRDKMVKIDTDLSAMLEAEGLAMRPGPRPRIVPGVLNSLRRAILGCEEVEIIYTVRGTSKAYGHVVHPYGFLYGNQHYLLAFNTYEDVLDYRFFRLSKIAEVKFTGNYFERDDEFNINEYAQLSFGVFQEEPFDVVWKVLPEAADDAREYMFHPTQTIEEQPDGSLIVKFRAGGALEMCWHLVTWGGKIEVISPNKLHECLKNTASKFI